MRVLTLLLTSICLAPITGLADDVTVGCPGGAGTYPSITAALLALPGNRNHTITISGACVEKVNVTDFENVSLTGLSGASITASGGPGVRVAFSKNITLQDLDIHVSGTPAIQVSDSSVDIRGCTLQGGSDGVQANSNSRVNIFGSTIQDNTGTGVSASGNSSVSIRPRMAQKTVIQRNGNGVAAGGGSSVSIISSATNPPDNSYYAVELLNNVYCGVYAVGASVEFSGTGQTRIANNGTGLAARGSVVNQISGVILIEDNKEVGVSPFSGSTIYLRACPTKRPMLKRVGWR